MAGRRRKSVEEQIARVEEQIQQIREKMDVYVTKKKQETKNLEAQLEEIHSVKRADEVQQLFSFMEERGLNIKDLEAMVEEKSEAQS